MTVVTVSIVVDSKLAARVQEIARSDGSTPSKAVAHASAPQTEADIAAAAVSAVADYR